MNYKNYLVRNKDIDLLSSLKELKLFTKFKLFREYEVLSLLELKEAILDTFEKNLITCEYEDTKLHFKELLENENGCLDELNFCDVQEMLLFIYEKDNEFHYYIPSEIKYIINENFSI